MKNRTTDSKNSEKTTAHDGTGIALSLLGGFFCVSVILSIRGNTSTNAMSAPVTGLIESIGHWPALILSLGIAGLGVALFLGEKAMSPGRHALGRRLLHHRCDAGFSTSPTASCNPAGTQATSEKTLP